MDSKQYNLQRYNRKKQWYRIRLGMLQLVHKPILNIFWILVIMASILLLVGKEKAMLYFNLPEVLHAVTNFCMNFIVVIVSIILALLSLETIGELSARKDEADLQEAFDKQELRNGCPILMNKKSIKGSKVTMREFYSSIPMRIWVERQEDIADEMNIHFVEKLRYGGKSDGKRIVMYTARGRKPIKRDDLYDEDF